MKRILRWLGIILGALALLVVIAAIAIYFRSESILNRTYSTPDVAITIPTDETAIARGKHLANYVSVCVDCHGANLEGTVFIDDPALGRVIAPNLTTGKNGMGAALSDGDFAKAIRYGVLPNGKSVRVMPADDYHHLSDEDLGAIIAYVRSLPPQDSGLPNNEMRPFGRVLLALGQLPIMIADRINFANTPPAAVKQEVSLDYGKYLGDIAGCTGCHGPGLSGGAILAAPPDWPLAANLTPSGDVGKWSEADFINTIRTGVNPAGKSLDQEMPWFRYSSMTDEELKALWLFIQSVPAQTFGNR